MLDIDLVTPEQRRQIIALVRRWTNGQIANALGLPIATVKLVARAYFRELYADRNAARRVTR